LTLSPDGLDGHEVDDISYKQEPEKRQSTLLLLLY